MATTLQLLLAERNAQRTEDARPPFTTVAALRQFVAESQPVKYDNVSVEMCILSLTEREQNWKMELVDKELELVFDETKAAVDALDIARRNKFVFQLTLWKEKKSTYYNDVRCCSGWTYRIDKIHSLTSRYGCPMGSLQLSQSTRIRRVKQDEEDPIASSVSSSVDSFASSTGSAGVEGAIPSAASAHSTTQPSTESSNTAASPASAEVNVARPRKSEAALSAPPTTDAIGKVDANINTKVIIAPSVAAGVKKALGVGDKSIDHTPASSLLTTTSRTSETTGGLSVQHLARVRASKRKGSEHLSKPSPGKKARAPKKT
jgi:hypothetical protein